ncbi:hypothetical protein CWE09_07375 [Aliidiomarina minuta]|uniref:Lipoprotein n=1 Tax=Aliidiomarina minuta TaxID=880057 RepID=A0A432W8W5_9GAMM|nr:hypothetical protein [Aliidiomarina minuta]RUO26519.1 hypothetical protein CWE09_07375 [Aliidiomarina minuta]
MTHTFKIITYSLSLILLSMLTACASYPLGMSEDEWESLTSEQQLQARSRQAELDQAERERRAEAARLAAQREQEERAAYEERLQNAAYGEVLQCVVRDAEGYLAGSWRPAAPAGFTLLRNHPTNVRFTEEGRPTRGIDGQATFDGGSVSLCRPNRNECGTLAGTQNQFRQGVQQVIDIPRLVRGTLYCDLPRPLPVHRHSTEVSTH